ncbi:MAG: DUF58 domain-containing protein [Phycisphaeraceae bacterium]|nr:DUF58 domain-containing protein [Phycisphaeraceae bacterium]MBX3367814.1 DUF58 domain-containing protein [Phycisphaeraceae bacterium]
MLIGQDTTRLETIDDLLGKELLSRLDRVDLLSRKVFGGKLPGERRSRRRGRSVEFDDFRPYVPGDDLRHIDWNVLARLERLVIKLFREDEDLALYLVVDASASMNAGEPSKLLAAHRMAMALGYVGLVNRARVIAASYGADADGRARVMRALRGRPSIERLGEFLLQSAREGTARGVGGGLGVGRGAAPAAETFERAMRTIARSRSGRGVVVLISDMLLPLEGASAGLSYLAGSAGFESFVIQTLSPGEIEPQTMVEKGLVGDLRLMDAESGRAAEVTITGDVIRRYKRNFEAHQEGLIKVCAARSITHVLTPTSMTADELVLRSLRARRLVG